MEMADRYTILLLHLRQMQPSSIQRTVSNLPFPMRILNLKYKSNPSQLQLTFINLTLFLISLKKNIENWIEIKINKVILKHKSKTIKSCMPSALRFEGNKNMPVGSYPAFLDKQSSITFYGFCSFTNCNFKSLHNCAPKSSPGPIEYDSNLIFLM